MGKKTMLAKSRIKKRRQKEKKKRREKERKKERNNEGKEGNVLNSTFLLIRVIDGYCSFGYRIY